MLSRELAIVFWEAQRIAGPLVSPYKYTGQYDCSENTSPPPSGLSLNAKALMFWSHTSLLVADITAAVCATP